MNGTAQRLWPFKPRASLISTAVLLVGLLLLAAVLRAVAGWPTAQSERNMVLIGVLVLGLLPILLALLDVIIERGGTVEALGVKVNFSAIRDAGLPGFTVPANIGVPGEPINDSSTKKILDSLKQATESDLAVINLGDGGEWWETRLLVLLAGAERLGKPRRIVFVGMDAKMAGRFQGWSYVSDLLPCLVKAHPQYERSLEAARAAARQWELVEPQASITPGVAPPAPAKPTWIVGALATRHPGMAFNASTGLHNKLLAEQLLASDLGETVEQKEGARSISLVRLEELFRPVLIKECIDLSWPAERQLDAVLNTDEGSIAVTQDSKYLTLAPRLRLLNELLKSLVKKRQPA